MRHRTTLLILTALLAAPVLATSTLDFSGRDLLVQLSVSDSSERLVGLRVYRSGVLLAEAPPPRLRVLRWQLAERELHVVIERKGSAPRIELRAAGKLASVWVNTTRVSLVPQWQR